MKEILGAVAGATLICAATVVSPSPAHAEDGVCEAWEFPGTFGIVNDHDHKISSFAARGTHVDANSNIDGDPAAYVQGDIDDWHIEFNVASNGVHSRYTGIIRGDGLTVGAIYFDNGTSPPGTGWHGSTNLDCTRRKAPDQPPQAPVDQVRMKITSNLGMATADIKNLSSMAGTCAYDASDTKGLLPSVHRDVDLAPKGTAQIGDMLAPPLLSTYHVVLSCKGEFNGNQVEFGHVVQDVSSF